MVCGFFFFFNDTATTEIYTLSLHDALPISVVVVIILSVRCRAAAIVTNESVYLIANNNNYVGYADIADIVDQI